ncbi:hypothetical protein N2152v2_006677, partial [Parachlorella kessleri]
MGLPYGLQAMLKEGHKHLSGLEEAVMKNIEACKGLAQITRTSMGPNGMNKMVINHLEKLYVTNDAATITEQLEVQHPAAKLVVTAAQSQQQEIGDGTNFVLSFAGELLGNAEALLRDGLHPTEIADGYAKAGAKALAVLDTLVIAGSDKLDMRDKAAVGGWLGLVREGGGRGAGAGAGGGGGGLGLSASADWLAAGFAATSSRAALRHPSRAGVRGAHNPPTTPLLAGHTQVAERIKGSISSKLHGYEGLLAPLVAEACIGVLPANAANFNVDNVRVAKISGGGLHDSHVVKGMVLKRDVEGSIKSVEDAKVAVFAQGVDTTSTETKGTVLIRSAEELEGYSRGEEDRIEEVIKGIA